MSEAVLDAYGSSNPRGSSRRSGWTLERVLLVITCFCSVVGFTFGLGVQWQKTVAVEARVSAISADYVPREVYGENLTTLRQSIDRLTQTIDRLQGVEPVYQAPPTTTFPRGRIFDR